MASRLLLMRHAKAQWPSPGASDFDRPLTAIGIGEARSMGEMMQAAGLQPDRVLCSGARRCRETWQELSFLFDVAETDYDDTLYAGDAAGYLDLVRLYGSAGTLLLIGHNPMTEELAMALTSDRTGSVPSALAGGFPPGALAVISTAGSLADLRPSGGRLETFITPRELAE